MSSILNAILRSVSGVKVPETPDTPETPEKEGEEDLSFNSPTEIIIHRAEPYVYRRKDKSPQLAEWRKEQIERANLGRITSSTEKPIPVMHGPNSLPYARNPSGVDATLEEVRPEDPAVVFSQRMAEHLAKTPQASAVLRSQITHPTPASSPIKAAILDDPFKPLFQQAVASVVKFDADKGKADKTDKVDKTDKSDKADKADKDHIDKADSKADASANWRAKEVLTMDALFKKFSPSATPPSVKVPKLDDPAIKEASKTPFAVISDNTTRRRKPVKGKDVENVPPKTPKARTPGSKSRSIRA